jgi:hypothetical protein
LKSRLYMIFLKNKNINRRDIALLHDITTIHNFVFLRPYKDIKSQNVPILYYYMISRHLWSRLFKIYMETRFQYLCSCVDCLHQTDILSIMLQRKKFICAYTPSHVHMSLRLNWCDRLLQVRFTIACSCNVFSMVNRNGMFEKHDWRKWVCWLSGKLWHTIDHCLIITSILFRFCVNTCVYTQLTQYDLQLN